MTKCWAIDVILFPELLHHSYLIIPPKSKEFGVPMIRCLLILPGLLAPGSSYVVHNLRFSNSKDLPLSSAFMRTKVSNPTFSVTFGVDSGQNLHVSLSCCLFLRTLVIVVDVLRCVCMQLAQNHGRVHGHQSLTLRRISANYEPRIFPTSSTVMRCKCSSGHTG